MAEQPTADLNSQLIGRGLDTSAPQNTYVDFANNIVKNQQNQASQEQAIARATELAKQSKIDTSNQEGAQAAGLNPLLVDTMTPAEAVSYLKIILKEKGLEEDDALIDEWAKNLPPRVNRQIVENFANRFARKTTRAAEPKKYEVSTKIKIPEGSVANDLGLDADPTDASIGHVPADGMYQVLYDNEGNVLKFIPGGKETVDPTAKNDAKQANVEAGRWSKLEHEMDNVIKSSRGNSLSQAIFRANRALNEIASPTQTIPQVLSYISKDVSGIFQGGVPPVTGADKEEFETAFDQLNRFAQRYTGLNGLFGQPPGDTREKLIELIGRLRDSTLDSLNSELKSKIEGYRDIIDKDPDRYQRLVKDKENAIDSGLSATAKAAQGEHKLETTVQPVPGAPSVAAGVQTGAPQVDALAGVLGLKKKAPQGH